MNVGRAGRADSAIVEAIAKCAVAVARARNREQVIDAVVDQVMSLGASSASVLLVADDDESRLRLVAHRNLTPALVEGVALVTRDSPHLASRAVATGELQIIEDLDLLDPELLPARDLLVHTRSRSMLCAPLSAFGRLLGVLTWTYPEPLRASTEDRAAIRALAALFAIGIAKAVTQGSVEHEATYRQLVDEVAHRQRVEAALRDRETRLRAVFDHTLEFLGLLSADGVLLEANRTSLDFVAKTRADVVGKPFRDAPWWSESTELQDRLSAAIEQAARGEHARFEAQHTGGGGERLPVDFSVSPVRDENGTVVLLVPEGRDITERKEQERQREEWISIIAHDLRQPINAIHLWTHLLSKGATGEHAEGLAHIATSIKHLTRMTSDLLDASRVEAGRMELRRRATDVEQLVRDAIARHVEAGRDVRVEKRGTIPQLEIDAERIEQVLANLLSNSQKYGHADAPLEITIARADEGVRLSVTNSGEGIDAKDLPLLFRRFSRTARARAGKPTGAGLGLYIAAGLVEAHGGRVWADSEPGAQTTFHVLLPLP